MARRWLPSLPAAISIPPGASATARPGEMATSATCPRFSWMAGVANNPVLAPRLKMADLRGRSLMIHAGGDNHADHPAPLGGGGPRVACGVIQ